MARLVLRSLLVFVAAFALACSDSPSAPPADSWNDEVTLVDASSDIFWSRGCPAIGPLNALAILLISHNNEDRRQVIARLGELNDEVRARRRDRIRTRAHALVAWLFDRYHAGKFRGSDQQFAALVNAIYCFAGIDLSIPTPANTELILPSDQPQVVTTENGKAGVKLPSNPVTEPTLLTVVQLPDTFTGPGLLDTKLDQYPGFVVITKQSENDAPLAKPVVVGVCATGVIPAAVRSRLRLGHGKASGFAIAAPGNADFLDCPNQVAAAPTAPLWQKLATALLPAQLHAFQAEAFGGGVGGTVTEFSPFAPVDPQLEFGGGVGGTVTEFIRVPGVGSKGYLDPSIVVDPCVSGRVGQPVSLECLPQIRITTRLGTPLTGVPITWSVTAGGGAVSARTSVCGPFTATALTLTNADGRAGACWRLGVTGTNRIQAVPAAGGDAPAGVSFTPAVKSFEMEARAGVPAAIQIVQGGELQRGLTPGALVPIQPIIRVVDADGYPVPGVVVKWGVDGFAGQPSEVTPTLDETRADGTSTTTWIMGAGLWQVYAKFYVLPDGTVSTTMVDGAVELSAVFQATTDP